MRMLAAATMVLAASAMPATAQVKAPATAEPSPTPSSAMSSAGKLPPSIVPPKSKRRVVRRPKGEPIVQGNSDIFVDSYGQLSTTMQP